MYKALLRWMEGHKDVVVNANDPWDHLLTKFYEYLGFEQVSVFAGTLIHSQGTIVELEGEAKAFDNWYSERFAGDRYVVEILAEFRTRVAEVVS